MKKILVCCGSGIATSTVASDRLTAKLSERGYGGNFSTVQCRVSEIRSLANDCDLIVSTSVIAPDIRIPVVLGISFLTGIGVDKTIDDIVSKLSLN